MTQVARMGWFGFYIWGMDVVSGLAYGDGRGFWSRVWGMDVVSAPAYGLELVMDVVLPKPSR